MTLNDKKEAIKKMVTVQKYFDTVIIPNMSFYYDGEYVDFDSKPTCKCPLHSEDTPSFRCYTHTNSFFCFGCGEGGDILALHEKFMDVNMATKVTFEESVRFLYDTFVAGGETARAKIARVQSEDDEQQYSSNIELIRFTRYRDEVEKELISLSGVDVKNKFIAYTQMDKLDKLVGMGLMNATDALEALKKTYSGVKLTKIKYGVGVKNQETG